MPTLNWIGRKAVENHHKQVPFHLLKEEPALSVGDPGSAKGLFIMPKGKDFDAISRKTTER